MRAFKLYLAAAFVLMVVALALGVYVWYTLQSLDRTISSPSTSPRVEETAEVTPEEPLPEDIVIETKELPDTQQKILEGLGYDSGTFTITGEMLGCAESSLGTERLEAIMHGAAPTPLESMKLLPCLKR